MIDPDAALFTFGDVKQLYIVLRKRLFQVAIGTFLLAFLALGSRGASYKIEASFQESPEQMAGSAQGVLKELLGQMPGTQAPQAASFMRSYQVLKPLIEKTGLQMTPVASEHFFVKIYKRYRDALRAERAQPLKEIDSFVFSDVEYEGEIPLVLAFCFSDTSHFTIRDIQGEVGKEIRLPDVRFTLQKVPEHTLGKYLFEVEPWIGIAKGIRGQIKVIVDKDNKSIYNLSFLHRNRYLGVQIINEMMGQYQRYLKREFDQLAKQQIQYLETKQGQVAEKFDAILDERVDYYRRNLSESYLLGLDEGSRNLMGAYSILYDQLSAIDSCISALDEVKNKRQSLASLMLLPVLSAEFEKLSSDLRDLQTQKDLIETCFSHELKTEMASMEAKRAGLREIKREKAELDQMLNGREIAALDGASWAQGEDDLLLVVESRRHLLSVREKMLRDASLYDRTKASSLEGIDLKTARKLFVQYNTKLDEAEATIRHLERVKTEVQRSSFELGSLSLILKDPISQKLIGQASSLTLQLKDEKHCSAKEVDRWKEEITLHRKWLADHIDQLHQVEKLNIALLKEKMADLNHVSLDCINRQFAVLEGQAELSVKEHKQNFLQERVQVAKKMEDLQKVASTLPEKWRLEKWMALRMDMVGKVMESMTQAVESKTISSHMHRVASKPLDAAFVPFLPEKPRLFMKSFAAALLISISLFCGSFFKKLLRGFPLTAEKFHALKLPLLGSVTSICDGPTLEPILGSDLDLLRRLNLFSEGAKVVGLMASNGPDYSYVFGENLGRMGVNSVFLRCDFHTPYRAQNCPGLLQVLNRELKDLPIRNAKGFDYVTAGGFTPFGAELIQSLAFNEIIETLQNQYDRIFLLFRAPLNIAESAIAMKLCDKIVATVSNESIEELTPLIHWGYDRSKITFVTKV